jgi:hypothetical protein
MSVAMAGFGTSVSTRIQSSSTRGAAESMVLTNIRKLLLLGSVGLASCSSPTSVMTEPMVGELMFYYLPFSVETFLPATVDSIERDARCVLSFKPSEDEMKALREALGSMDPGGFDRKRVRLKILGLELTAIFVDADGGLRKGGKNVGRVTASAFRSLEQFVEAVARREGCAPHG